MTFDDAVAITLTPPSLLFYTVENNIGWVPALACALYWVYKTYNEYKKNSK